MNHKIAEKRINKSMAMVVKKVSPVIPVDRLGNDFFGRLADELRGELAPPKLGYFQELISGWTKVLEAFEKNIKSRILDVLRGQGTQVTSKGSLEYEENGTVLSARPWRTGYDGKKLEALLRAKQKNPAEWMDMEVTYIVNEQKLGAAIQAGVLSQNDLDTFCRAGLDKDGNQIMAVQPVKRAS